MEDEKKTRAQLIEELNALRRRPGTQRATEGEPGEMEVARQRRDQEHISLLAQIVDIAPNSILVHDSAGRIFYANQRTFDMHGYSAEEFMAANLRDIDVPESAELISSRMQEIEERGEASFEVRHRRKDGTTFPLQVFVKRIEWAGSPAMLNIGTDITERKIAEKTLRESEEKYRSLFDNINLGVALHEIITDEDGTPVDFLFLDANPTYEELTRLKKVDIVGKRGLEVIPNIEQRWIDIYGKVAQTGESTTIQDHSEYLDRYWEVKAYSPQRNQFAVAMTDITERRRTEEELKESQKRYRELFASSPISLWEEDFSGVASYLQTLRQSGITDLRAHLEKNAECATRCAAMVEILDVNEATLRMYEAETPRELFSNLNQVFIEESMPAFGKQLLAIWEGEVDVECETFNQTLKGHRKDLFLKWRVIPGHEETYAKVVVSILDITESKRAQEEVLESEQRFRFLIEKSPLGIALISSEGRYLYLNPAFENMFGYTLEDIPTGRIWFDRVYPNEEVREEVKAQWIAGLKEYSVGEVWPRVFDVQCKDGSFKTIHFKPVIMDDGRQLVMYEDITQQRRMEEELRRAHNLESLGILAGGIAHDFNNVLTGVIGNLSLLEHLLDRDSAEYEIAGEAQKAAAKTTGLTQQLMTFAKGGAPIKETASIEKLIRETASLSLRGANTRAEFRFAEDLPPVDIDTGQIGQVIQNLVINADQAMPEGGILTISAESVAISGGNLPLQPGTYVKVAVEDRGGGIPESIQDKIFDPYFSTKERGHGLGLSICHSIVQRHGGHITVLSKPNVGTSFEFYLPASGKRLAASADQEKAISAGSGRILLMDDEEIIQQTVGRILRLLGYEIVSVDEGEEAIRAYREALGSAEPFDLVIMDLTIPGGMGGKEAMGRLRQIDPQARVIVSSGYSNDPVMADFSQYGFAGRIAKPVDIEELAETVKQVLDRA